MTVVPKVPEVPDSRNTKKIVNPARNWCFTLNNYSEEDINNIKECEELEEFVFQEETGQSGTKHLQGYIKFLKKRRPFEVFKNNSFHWEVCRNISASKLYCQKADTRTGEVFIKNKSEYSINIELYDWEKRICEILDSEPDDRTLHWIWESEGGVGKTTFQKWVFLNYKKVIVLSGKSSDMKYGVVKFQETNGYLPRIVLINIPRTSIDYVSYAGIEDIKDMFFYSGKYEGGMVCGPSPHVLIFANERPQLENVSQDRWNIIKL